MEHTSNDYTSLDFLFPNRQTLNEDAPVIEPSIVVNNPPASGPAVVGKPSIHCPLCLNAVDTPADANMTYKCGKCGKSFTLKEETMKEASGAEESLIKDMTTDLGLVMRSVKELHDAMVNKEFDKITVSAIETPMNALNDIRKQLGGQTWVDMTKKAK